MRCALNPRNEGVVVVLTALDLEYKAVRRYLTDVEAHRHEAGTRFEIGGAPNRAVSVAINLVEKGNLSAAVLAERAIAEFQPLAVLFVGVAGALRDDIRLGDVVAATHVYAYHGGTSEDARFSARPRVWEAPHELTQLAGELARTEEWIGLLGRAFEPGAAVPKVHRRPIAAGEVVLQSRTSEEWRRLALHYNDAAAVEMEGAGLAQAGQLNSVPAMAIRGISDGASADKTVTDRAGWQPIAAGHAAAFAIALAERIGAESGTRGPARRARRAVGRRGRAEMDDSVATVAPTFHNVAQGSATVGVQAGQIYGGAYVNDVTAAGEPEDLGTQLKNLREALEAAYRERQVDPVTYEAAQEELSEAEASLPPDEPTRRRRLVLALKRLKGLVEEVADFAAKVTRILAGLESLR